MAIVDLESTAPFFKDVGRSSTPLCTEADIEPSPMQILPSIFIFPPMNKINNTYIHTRYGHLQMDIAKKQYKVPMTENFVVMTVVERKGYAVAMIVVTNA